MKKLTLILLAVLFASVTSAQQKDYRVVFDVTSKDTLAHQTAIRQASLILNNNPDAKIEIVLLGHALNMVVKDKSTVLADLEKLLQNKNAAVKVCEVTMQRYKVDKAQLVAGVTAIPDGIYEIISKQREGWGYIKVAQ